MTKITYKIGDATSPEAEGAKIIPHICNNIGAWGAGFVLALSKKWSSPEKIYRAMSERILGTCKMILVEDDIHVMNMIAQDDISSNHSLDYKGKSPIRYDALIDCLRELNTVTYLLGHKNPTVHMPRIGSGLAGGNWTAIAALIEENLSVPVTVYDLKPIEGTVYE